jgi:hypothetical protein
MTEIISTFASGFISEGIDFMSLIEERRKLLSSSSSSSTAILCLRLSVRKLYLISVPVSEESHEFLTSFHLISLPGTFGWETWVFSLMNSPNADGASISEGLLSSMLEIVLK